MSLMQQLHAPTVGMVVGDRYELIEEIGRGGFGVVFRARHRNLDEDVAVKLLLPDRIVSQELMERFRREVAVAKGLRNPNNVRILDCSVTDTGLPYYVMEYVKGPSLRALIRNQGPLSPARVQQLGIQILGALEEAHSRGIVHRDLKPTNIIIADVVGRGEFVKVLDYGIAKAFADLSTTPVMTQSGAVLGTPAYMSPEQARSEKDIDGRADLYSLGLIIAECLYGEAVIQTESPLEAVVYHMSPQPIQYAAWIYETSLGQIITCATEKDRNKRYADARSMRIALDALNDLSKQPQVFLKASDQTPPITQPPWLPMVTPQPAVSAPTTQVAGGPSATKWLIVFLAAILLLSGVLIAVVLSSSGDEEPDSTQTPHEEVLVTELEDEAAPAEEPVSPVLPEQLPDHPNLVTPPETTNVTPTDTDTAAMPNAALLTVAPTVAVASDRLHASVPSTHLVRFDGTDDVTVSWGGRVLGTTPFRGYLPRVDRTIELDFERSGYRSRTETVSLTETVVDINLRRDRSDDDDDDSEEEEIPFGGATIRYNLDDDGQE